MKKLPLVTSCAAMIIGLGVAGISLASASQVFSSEEVQASQLKFYLDEEILPDHIAYPVLMVADRVKLEMAPRADRVHLQIEYAQRRLIFAKALLAKEEKELAFSTLTKSQKYLNNAAIETLEASLSAEVKNMVVAKLEANDQEIQQLSPYFDTQNQSILNHLCKESEILKMRLTE